MIKFTIFNSVTRHFSNVSAFLKDSVCLNIQTGFYIDITEKKKKNSENTYLVCMAKKSKLNMTKSKQNI